MTGEITLTQSARTVFASAKRLYNAAASVNNYRAGFKLLKQAAEMGHAGAHEWLGCTITGWARDQTGVWRSRITKSQLTPADRTPSITWASFTTMDVLFREITAWLFNGFARLPHTAIKRLFIG
jgi:hypothetical protein